MNQQKGLFWVVVGLIAVDILRYIGMDGSLQYTNSTYYTAIIIYLSSFWLLRTQAEDIKVSKIRVVKIWIFLLFLSIFFGMFRANNYWDWKHLMLNVLGFSISPLFFFVGLKIRNVSFVNNIYFRSVFIFGFFLIPIGIVTNYELYARIMIPVTFLFLFFSYVGKFSKILLLLVVSLSLITAPDFRSLQIKIAFVTILVLGSYLRRFVTKKVFLTAHVIIFLIPILVVSGALFFDYNFFRDGINPKDQVYNIQVGENESDLLSDTRSFLYLEVSSDLEGYEWIVGKGAAGSYHSSFYGSGGGDERGKRYQCEVGVLNILNQTGLIGVLVYVILLFSVTRRAIQNSRSYLVSALAILLACRWLLIFIEEFTQYDLNFFFFWLLLGFISNKDIQQIKDRDIGDFINSKRGRINLIDT